jgi:UDP-N-acetylglucosamine--N-acetylmuramyl-(pentapeptide) pyrophosphoryl-undecaprenol N-acetylglucosamine transferase
MPVIGVIGGSLGAKIINDTVVNILPDLLEHYQIIHQTGKKQFEEIQTDARITLGDDTRRTRYKVYPYLSDLETKMFGGACDIIVSRAGSTIFEIAAWGKPSIIIPGRGEIFHGDHQRKNAYHYARTGACTVIEESNLTSSVLKNEIDLILKHQDRYDAMAGHARHFYKADAAHVIAAEAIKIALGHES